MSQREMHSYATDQYDGYARLDPGSMACARVHLNGHNIGCCFSADLASRLAHALHEAREAVDTRALADGARHNLPGACTHLAPSLNTYTLVHHTRRSDLRIAT